MFAHCQKWELQNTGGSVKQYSHSGEQFGNYLEKVKMQTPITQQFHRKSCLYNNRKNRIRELYKPLTTKLIVLSEHQDTPPFITALITLYYNHHFLIVAWSRVEGGKELYLHLYYIAQYEVIKNSSSLKTEEMNF